MKKLLIALLALVAIFTLTACNDEKEEESSSSNKTSEKEKKNKEENNKEEENNKKEEENNKKEENNNKSDDDIIIDDDIIEDDEDNQPPEGELVVDEIVNCTGCVFGYFDRENDDALKLGDTLSPSEYTTNINTIKKGSKQRHNFFGFVLDSSNKITRAYSCIWKANKIYCIEGSTNGAYFNENVGILQKIFGANNCKYLSNGNTYWCTDTQYTGDTSTTGYTSLHYETSCTIYGSDANTGKLICH